MLFPTLSACSLSDRAGTISFWRTACKWAWCVSVGPAAVNRLAMMAGLAVDAIGHPIKGAEKKRATQLASICSIVATVTQHSRWQAARVRRQLAPEPVPIRTSATWTWCSPLTRADGAVAVEIQREVREGAHGGTQSW